MRQAEIETQQKLLNASLDAQEKERKRIASDLHDDIGSLLTALKLNLNHLKSLEQFSSNEKEFLDQSILMLDDGLTNVRSISHDLMPPTLVRFGIWEAINELANRINDSGQIWMTVQLDAGNPELSERAQLGLFRVIQELTSNSLKHAEASEIKLSFELSNEQLKMSYSDNGKGITSETQLSGLGMITMKSRIKALNGEMEVSSEKKANFQALISIPLAQIETT